jgi:hypothetical protein
MSRRRKPDPPKPAPRSLSESVTVDELVSALLEIRGSVAEIRSATVKQWLTVPEIGRRYLAGRSATWIRARPWALPNFGEPDIPGRPEAWYVATCEEWYRTPLHAHEARYLRGAREQMEGGDDGRSHDETRAACGNNRTRSEVLAAG